MDKKELKPVYSTTMHFECDDDCSLYDMSEPILSADGRLRVCADFAVEYFGIKSGLHEIEIYTQDPGADALKLCAPPAPDNTDPDVAVQLKDGTWEYECPHPRTANFLHKLSVACKSNYLWVKVYELGKGCCDSDDMDSEFFKALESMSQ